MAEDESGRNATVDERDPAETEADKLRIQGNDFYKKGSYDEAIVLYSHALAQLEESHDDPDVSPSVRLLYVSTGSAVVRETLTEFVLAGR